MSGDQNPSAPVNMDEREKHIRALVSLMTANRAPSPRVACFLDAGEYGLALAELAGEINDTTAPRDPICLRFYTEWASDDQEFAGLCVEFPSLSHLAATRREALVGITDLVSEVLKDINDAAI